MTVFLWLALAAQDPEVSFETRKLSTIPDDLDHTGKIVFSPDGRTVSYKAVERSGGDTYVMAGDQRGEDFSRVDDPFFSPDGKSLLYVATEGNRYCLVVDGKSGERFDRLEGFLFGPDGHTAIYRARRAEDAKWCLVIGEKKGEFFDRVEWSDATRGWNWVVLPDGHHVAYGGAIGDKTFMFRDHQKGEGFAGVGSPLFFPDGTIVYCASQGPDGEMVVVGDRKGEPVRRVNELVLSAQGQVVAYTAYPKGDYSHQVVTIGEQKSEVYDHAQTPALSADGKVAAYLANKEGKWILVHGGKTTPVEGEPTRLVLSPDGSVVAYAAVINDFAYVVCGDRKIGKFHEVTELGFGPDGKTLVGKARKGDLRFLLVGDHKSEGCESERGPVFSRDEKLWAYAAYRRRKWFVVVNGKKGPDYDNVGGQDVEIVASPDGSKVAYSASDESGSRAVVGEENGPTFLGVGTPVFSPDGSKVAYSAQIDRDKCCMVLAGKNGEPFYSVGVPRFAPDGKTICYPAVERGVGQYVVLGEKKFGPFDEVLSRIAFSPDGKKAAFGVRKGRELWWQAGELR